jgi:hypothetical protein
VSDARIRELERRARAGDGEAKAQLLIEWARAGEPACKTAHRLMLPDEVTMARALAECSFSPGSWDKRFARTLSAQTHGLAPWITAAQARHLRRMVKRYRRQVPKAVVRLASAHYEEAIPLPLRVASRRQPGACATCWEPFGRHTPKCPEHPVNAAKRAREALGMFAPTVFAPTVFGPPEETPRG